jgi:hypothetical protein
MNHGLTIIAVNGGRLPPHNDVQFQSIRLPRLASSNSENVNI